MSFDYYFTGLPNSEEIINYILDNNICLLFSQLNDRRNIEKWIEMFKERPECRNKLFVDSGAFSAWTLGKKIDVDDYINFLNDNDDYITLAASVDTIPGKPRSSEIPSGEEIVASAQDTWDNYLYMRKKLNNKDMLVYTYHAGEPVRFLEQALKYEDEFGQIQNIALGGMIGKSTKVITQFLTYVFDVIDKLRPGISVHAFGMTRPDIIEKFEITSADSTTFLIPAVFGKIQIGEVAFPISNESSYKKDNYCNLSSAAQKSIEKEINKRGFSVKDLQEDSYKRMIFNIDNAKRWSDHLKRKKIKHEKCVLW